VLRLWARVLLQVPGSRLVLKNKPFACEVVRNHYWRLFEEAGVERSRVREPAVAGPMGNSWWALNRVAVIQCGLV